MEFTSVQQLENHYIMSVITPLIKDYYDKGIVLSHLEDLIILPGRIKNIGTKEDSLYEEERSLEQHTLHTAEEVFHMLEKELELRRTTFEAIRTLYPDFCSSIKSTLTEEQYHEYLALQKKILQCLYKVQSLEDPIEHGKSYDDDLLERKDFISSLIDSESTSRLSALEDTFLLEQLNLVNPNLFNHSIQNKIHHLKTDLSKRLNGYELFKKLYFTPNSEIRLKLEQKTPTEREK